MGKKRTCTNTFEFISWDRVDIVACSCPDKTYLHVHCPCEQCKGKATSRKVELQHWKRSQLLRVKRVKQDERLHESDTTFSNQEQETPQESNLDLSEEERYFSVDDTPETREEIRDSIDSSNKNNLKEHDDIPTNCFISVGKILCCNQFNKKSSAIWEFVIYYPSYTQFHPVQKGLGLCWEMLHSYK